MPLTATTRSRTLPLRYGALLIGLIVPQVILYGPSLVGQKLLLPLDILKSGGNYLPPEEVIVSYDDDGNVGPINPFRPHNDSLSDQVFSYEIERRFVAAEFRAGRIPLWTPFQFAGAPFVNWPKYSPFSLMYCLFPSPKSLAWIQLVKSVVGGIGAFLFFRRALFLSFWPSTIAAWCFPLTAHFALWQGYPQTYVTIWLPWILLVTDRVVRRPGSWAGPALAVVTALVLISGQLDTAGHVLIASGIFAIFCLVRDHRSRLVSVRTFKTVGVLIGAWGIGFLLSAPELLPIIEYAPTGTRLSDVNEIVSDRPPSGIRSLPRLVLPKINGSHQRGWHHFGGISEFETASAAYTGILATLVVAPLAWSSRRHRSMNVVLLILALVGLGWELNIPGIVHVLQLPGFNLRPHNRFVFVASFSLVAYLAIGLDVLWKNRLKASLGLWIPPALLLITAGYCVIRAVNLPEPLATEFIKMVQEKGITTRNIPNVEAVHGFQASYRNFLLVSAAICLFGLIATAGIWWQSRLRRRFAILLAPLFCAELIWYGFGMNPQCDPQLYYPKIPILERLATLPSGRVLGIGCLPPKVNELYGLYEIRGYDGVDPGRYVQLLLRFVDRRFFSPRYAKLQFYAPSMSLANKELLLPPVLNMLGVRYVIFSPLSRPLPPDLTPVPALKDLTTNDGYLIVESDGALPRAFIPRTAVSLKEPAHVFALVTRDDFAPHDFAYVEGSVTVPRDCRGTATITSETSGEVVVAVEMETDGLLVLADRWDRGWRAYSGERELPVLRTNYVLRGVKVSPQDSTIVFRYEPQSFLWGVRLMLFGLVALICWTIASARSRRFWPG